jgi:hypothetical protein
MHGLGERHVILSLDVTGPWLGFGHAAAWPESQPGGFSVLLVAGPTIWSQSAVPLSGQSFPMPGRVRSNR